jgi:glutathione S-transferase
MWVDYINSNVGPAAQRVLSQVTGKTQSDQKSFSIAVHELRTTLNCIESHLRLRNYLVGYQLTLADALLVSVVSVCFELVFDKKTRKGSLPNLSRYT